MAYGMKVQCINKEAIAKLAVSFCRGSKPKLTGGSLRWNIGSAVPQNKMPVAIVVQSVIENHFQRLKNGLASFPPILTLANGEK